jgi:hypothetical protein
VAVQGKSRTFTDMGREVLALRFDSRERNNKGASKIGQSMLAIAIISGC